MEYLCKGHSSTLGQITLLSVFQFPQLYNRMIIKATIKYLEQGLAHKIFFEGKILVRVLKVLKINHNPIFRKYLNNVNHTISEKYATIFEPDSILSI